MVAIGETPAASSLGRSRPVLSPLQREERLSQGSLKYCSVITWMNSFVLLLYIQRAISEDSSHPSNNRESRQRPAGRAERRMLLVTERHLCSKTRRFCVSKCLAWRSRDARAVPNQNTCYTNCLGYVFAPAVGEIGSSLTFNLISVFGVCKLPAAARGSRMQHEAIMACWR